MTDIEYGETYVLDDNYVLKNVHRAELCAGWPCVIHNPTPHHMADWTLHWRDDRGIFERICEHGIGHPDPDQFDFWYSTNQTWQAVHGCDGCCFQKQDDLVEEDDNADSNG